MKQLFGFLILFIGVLSVSCTDNNRAIVILSTNDMHAAIERFPLLATAVQECRDTANVILVDAGDKWTGNAYVDMAKGRLPIINLMNKIEYDVATLGNHEFDAGHATLDGAIEASNFTTIIANLKSDTIALRNVDPYTIIEIDGTKIGFVGVLTNYEGDKKPAGLDHSYRKLTFADPQEMAAKYATIKDKCDYLVLVSHMGSSHDLDFIKKNQEYNLLIGGHSHEVINEVIGKTILQQTGKNLANIGVTVLNTHDKRVNVVSHEIISLDKYKADAEYTKLVEQYHDNPELKRKVGSFTAPLTKEGFANFMADAINNRIDTDITFYNIGGVRLDTHPEGDISLATVFSLEPFGSQIWTMEMTPKQMKKLIISKFNDKENLKEAHRIDLYSTTPYTIITNKNGDATDVKFSKLKEGKTYSVAMGDYIVKKYKDLECRDKKNSSIYVTDALLQFLKDKSPIISNNKSRQSIE